MHACLYCFSVKGRLAPNNTTHINTSPSVALPMYLLTEALEFSNCNTAAAHALHHTNRLDHAAHTGSAVTNHMNLPWLMDTSTATHNNICCMLQMSIYSCYQTQMVAKTHCFQEHKHNTKMIPETKRESQAEKGQMKRYHYSPMLAPTNKAI